jgi:hypothetical protein
MSSDHASQAREKRDAVVLAVVIIAALATAIGVFVMQAPRGTAAGRGGGTVKAQPGRPGVAQIPVRPRAELVRGAQNTDRLNPRQHYAARINRQLRAKGRTCVIRATGELGRDMTISWTRRDFESEGKAHFEKLKISQGFFETLRSLRYSRLIMKVDDKVVFTKSFE